MRVVANINLAALRHNLTKAASCQPNAQVVAVVKANAYHHGLAQVCRALESAHYFAVAALEEADQLRQLQLPQPIVVLLGFSNDAELDALRAHNYHSFIYNWHQIALLRANPGQSMNVWLKINTGMNRYGFAPEEVGLAYQALKDTGCRIHAVASHFACADQPGNELTTRQLQAFFNSCPRNVKRSLSNSSALLTNLVEQEEFIRPGLMLYGISPFAHAKADDLGLQPVMSLQAKVLATYTIEPGATVGYGASWQASKPTTIALIGAGYGDGYPQYAQGAPVLLHQQLVPVIGRTAMDSLAVDISNLEGEVNIGDWATLWGKGLPIEKVAAATGRSPYDLITSVSGRVTYSYKKAN